MRSIFGKLLLSFAAGSSAASVSTSAFPSNNLRGPPRPIIRHLQQLFCGQCLWKGTTIACDARAQFLVDTYDDLTVEDARVSIFDECNTNDGEPMEPVSVNIDVFCDGCMWKNRFKCDERLDYLMTTYKLSEEKGKESLIELGHCITPGADPTLLEADTNATISDTIGDTNNSTEMNLIIFCGTCLFPQSDMTCDEKAQVRAIAAELTLEEAKVSILPSCFRSPDAEPPTVIDRIVPPTNQGVVVRVQAPESTSSPWLIIGIILIALLVVLLVVLAIQARRNRELRDEVRELRDKQNQDDVENNPAIVVTAVVEEELEKHKAEDPPTSTPECAPEIEGVQTDDASVPVSTKDAPDNPVVMDVADANTGTSENRVAATDPTDADGDDDTPGVSLETENAASGIESASANSSMVAISGANYSVQTESELSETKAMSEDGPKDEVSNGNETDEEEGLIAGILSGPEGIEKDSTGGSDNDQSQEHEDDHETSSQEEETETKEDN